MKNRVRIIIALSALILWDQKSAAHSSLARNDPYPVYTTAYPYAQPMLAKNIRYFLKGWSCDATQERFYFSASPFFQRGCIGRDVHHHRAELGDLQGRWNLIGLTYGDIPDCQCRGPILDTAFQEAKFCECPHQCPAITDIAFSSTSTCFMHDPHFADPEQLFGFISAPLDYHKGGIRFCGSIRFSCDFGVTIETGVADISQVLIGTECSPTSTDRCIDPIPPQGIHTTPVIVPGFLDLTPSSTFAQVNKEVVDLYFTSRAKEIFNEIGLNVDDYHRTSIEDIRLSLFWRHAFEVNKYHTPRGEYPQFLFIPFAIFEATIATGDPIQFDDCGRTRAFSLPFGNNGHHAVGFTGGLAIDFYETIEIASTIGFTHFFDKDFHNMPIPTHELQSGIYPFRTDVNLQPGHNWVFTIGMNAEHFLDKLSFYAQFVLVSHSRDKICLLKTNTGVHVSADVPARADCPLTITPEEFICADPDIPCCNDRECCFNQTCVDCVFKPQVLEALTPFMYEVFNFGFNYDISPNVALGFLFQAPVGRRNAYRTTTLMGSIQFTF